MQLMKEHLYGDDSEGFLSFFKSKKDEKSHLVVSHDVEYQRRLSEGGPITKSDVLKLEGVGNTPLEEAAEIERLAVRLSGIRHQKNEELARHRAQMDDLNDDENSTISEITERHGRMQQWVDRYDPNSMPPVLPQGDGE